MQILGKARRAVTASVGISMLTAVIVSSAESVLWFGAFVDDDGQLQQGRYHLSFAEGNEEIVALQLAPYGKRPIDFRILSHHLDSGLLSIEWPGKPNKKANLFRYSPTYYAGNWVEGDNVQPMIIKAFNGDDAELQGHWFKPSDKDIAIVRGALQLLHHEEQWNQNDDRVCDQRTSYSVFCALFHASINVDGQYRHLRPAMKTVRDTIEQRYPRQYDHVLVGFNNADETTLEDVRGVLRQAIEELKKKMSE